MIDIVSDGRLSFYFLEWGCSRTGLPEDTFYIENDFAVNFWQVSCPEINWSNSGRSINMYLPGTSSDQDNYNITFQTANQKYVVLKGLMKVFPNEEILYNGEIITDFFLGCNICGASITLCNASLYSHGIYCSDCTQDIKVCPVCNSLYYGNYCSTCYTKDYCQFCSEERLLNKVRVENKIVLLCEEHIGVKLVPIFHYNYKPDPFTFHHLT